MVLTAAAPTMGSLMGDLATVGTKVFSVVSDVASTIVSQPILLMTTGILFVGGCIGIFGRLLSKN